MLKLRYLPITLLLFTLSLSLTGLSWSEDDSFRKARQRMVERDLRGRDIVDQRVLEVMGRVKRHLFVDNAFRRQAYADHPLPIAEGQTISQPYIVAFMTQVAGVRPGEKVLEVGTGSGYQAAVLSEIAGEVFTVEIRKGLAESAERRLEKLGHKNVTVKYGDGYYGWKGHGPFDAILVTAAANHIPPPLVKQLKVGGRLVIPLGSTTFYQTLTLITKKEKKLEVKQILDVRFVPMTGEVQKK